MHKEYSQRIANLTCCGHVLRGRINSTGLVRPVNANSGAHSLVNLLHVLSHTHASSLCMSDTPTHSSTWACHPHASSVCISDSSSCSSSTSVHRSQGFYPSLSYSDFRILRLRSATALLPHTHARRLEKTFVSKSKQAQQAHGAFCGGSWTPSIVVMTVWAGQPHVRRVNDRPVRNVSCMEKE